MGGRAKRCQRFVSIFYKSLALFVFQQNGEKIMHVLNEMNTEREPEFVRDAEGAKLACVSVNTFRKLADEFGAVYRIGKIRVTDWGKFKAGLEAYRG